MSEKDNRNRGFYDFVINQAQRCPWVSKSTESEWLQRATFDLQIEPYEASSFILGATSTAKVYAETEVERIADDLVTSFASRRGCLSHGAFHQLTTAIRHMSRGNLDQNAAEQLVKDAIARQDLKPRGRGPLASKRWFRQAGNNAVKA